MKNIFLISNTIIEYDKDYQQQHDFVDFLVLLQILLIFFFGWSVNSE